MHIPEHIVPQSLSHMKYIVICVPQGYSKIHVQLFILMIREILTWSLKNLVVRKLYGATCGFIGDPFLLVQGAQQLTFGYGGWGLCLLLAPVPKPSDGCCTRKLAASCSSLHLADLP